MKLAKPRRRLTAEHIRRRVRANLWAGYDVSPSKTSYLCQCFPSNGLRGWERDEFSVLLDSFTTLREFSLGRSLYFGDIYAVYDTCTEAGIFVFEQQVRFMFAELLALLVEDGQ